MSGEACRLRGFRARSKAGLRGFTLIELLVVLAILGALLAIAAPRYFDHVDRAKENTLKHNLVIMREAIDQYQADRGRWPPNLQALVDTRYLRSIPVDPITESNETWILVQGGEGGGVQSVRSGAPGEARDGRRFTDW